MKDNNRKKSKEKLFNSIKNDKLELPKDYKFNREELYERNSFEQNKQIDDGKVDKDLKWVWRKYGY